MNEDAMSCFLPVFWDFNSLISCLFWLPAVVDNSICFCNWASFLFRLLTSSCKVVSCAVAADNSVANCTCSRKNFNEDWSKTRTNSWQNGAYLLRFVANDLAVYVVKKVTRLPHLFLFQRQHLSLWACCSIFESIIPLFKQDMTLFNIPLKKTHLIRNTFVYLIFCNLSK